MNAISDNSCGEQSFDSVEFVQEEEVECEEVFDSAYLIDNNSCEFLVKITYINLSIKVLHFQYILANSGNETFIIEDMNTSDDDSNDANSVHFSSANSLSDSKEEFVQVHILSKLWHPHC